MEEQYGYVVVLACFVGHVIIFGVTNSMGVFYVEFENAFPDFNGTIALVSSLNTGCLFSAGLVSSALTNIYGPRVVCILGGVISGVALIVAMLAQSVYTLYFSFGIAAGFGMGLCYIPVATTVPQYFSRRRTLAVGVSVCGAGIGSITFAPMIQYFIDLYSWRGSSLLLGGVVFNLCVCGSLLRPYDGSSVKQKLSQSEMQENSVPARCTEREQSGDNTKGRSKVESNGDSTIVVHGNIPDNTQNSKEDQQFHQMQENSVPAGCTQREQSADNTKGRPNAESSGDSTVVVHVNNPDNIQITKEDQNFKQEQYSARKSNPFDFHILKNISFLIFCLNHFLFCFGMTIVFVYLPAYAVSMDISHLKAALLISVIGIGNFFGRLLWGVIAHAPGISAICLYNLTYFCFGVDILLFPVWQNYGWLVAIAALFGVFNGSLGTLVPQVTVDIVGLNGLVSAYGYILFVEGLGALSGPPLAELLWNSGTNYKSPFYLAGAAAIMSSLIMVYPWWEIRQGTIKDK